MSIHGCSKDFCCVPESDSSLKKKMNDLRGENSVTFCFSIERRQRCMKDNQMNSGLINQFSIKRLNLWPPMLVNFTGAVFLFPRHFASQRP